MEEKAILYAAGNPDAYPLEYYDKESETYQGVIPQLLARFSAQSGYEVLYYPTQGEDRREHLAQNLQVDLLTGYGVGEMPPDCREQVVLFQVKIDGREQAVQLGITEAAPLGLKGELESFLAGVSQKEVTGILLETQVQPQDASGFFWAIGALILAMLLVTALLGFRIRWYRKRLRQAEKDGETDEVTGLGSMDYLLRYDRQVIHDKNRILYTAVYILVDTHRLRRVGGEQETNAFLRYCAVVLQEYTGDNDLLARISDQGFALLKSTGSIDLLLEQVGKILNRLRAYSQKYEKSFSISAAAGVYSLRSEDRDLNEVLFNAFQAARRALEERQDYVVFDSEMKRKFLEERVLQNSVNQALESGQFQLYLQFYVDAQTFQIIGGEALSRWKHPQRGVLEPGVFVPLLEREQLIDKLDYVSLEECCRFLDDLDRQGINQFFISCNFSRETFEGEHFVSRCREIIDRYCFPRELLIFELTESIAEAQSGQIQKNMMALKKYGVRMALDDFGEGVTSLFDLQEYPVDGIKLDKSLVTNCGTKPGITILRAVVQAGHELGLTVLAEGVEQDEEIRALQEIHCDVIQGFRFHRPIPARDARAMLLRKEQQRRTRS